MKLGTPTHTHINGRYSKGESMVKFD